MEQNRSRNALVPVETRKLPVPTKKTYWSKVSRIYTLISRALLVAMPLFVVVFLALCSRAFTYESIFCFAKDLQSTATFLSSADQTVTYTYEETDGTVLAFRGGIAAVNGGGVEVYSPGGEKLLEIDKSFRAPRAVASRKYLVAFDFGSKDFLVTNTYATLHKGSTDHPIYLARVDDTGQIALLTSSEEHLSCVTVYNGKFQPVQRFNKASATVDIALSDNGKYVAILGLVSEGGDPASLLEVYRIGKSEPEFVQRFEGEMPLALDFTDNRHLAVLSDAALRVCNADGKMKNEVNIADETPLRMVCNENGCMLALSGDAFAAENRILVLDKRGGDVYDGLLTGDITAIALAEKRAFLLLQDEVVGISLKNADTASAPCKSGAADILALDDEHLRVIYRGEAVYLDFKLEERQ